MQREYLHSSVIFKTQSFGAAPGIERVDVLALQSSDCAEPHESCRGKHLDIVKLFVLISFD